MAEYFGYCNTLKSEYEAMKEAKKLYDEIMDDDFCPIIEYGISYINGWENKDFPEHLVCFHNHKICIDKDVEQCYDCKAYFYDGDFEAY